MTQRILVVDDEPDVEALVVQKYRREIRAGAMEFRFAADGVEALAAVAAAPEIDVVVTDINMPRMDGLTLLSRLGEIENGPASMIVSAYGDMANIRTAMNRGAFDFVTKPIDFSDFETTLQKTLRHVTEQREVRRRAATAERAHSALSRYFSPTLAQRLAGESAAVTLQGQAREVAVLFTDIAGFTGLAESLDVPLLSRLLNEYLTGMTDIVFAHEGTLAKIVGDALNVLFNAPGDQPDHAARAVACARDLDAFAEALRARWLEVGVRLGVTRIGVHCGTAIVGNFGGDRFFDYTAYGDTINIAARLEAANKGLGTRVCVSTAVVAQVPDAAFRPVGDLMLRGRTVPVRAHEPLSRTVSDMPAALDYRAAFALAERRDAGALPAFATLVGRQPDDKLANFHLRRLMNGMTGTIIEVV
jgi:adenylate cyclase